VIGQATRTAWSGVGNYFVVYRPGRFEARRRAVRRRSGSDTMSESLTGVLAAMTARYGEDWLRDEDANERFAAESKVMLEDVDGAHLIGDPELEDDEVRFTVWVDTQIEDLLTADQIAYDIFSRIAEEVFYTERIVKTRQLDYPFLTGSSRHGHKGVLVLAGPHAAEFAQRHHVRTTGAPHFHA
jgi:hypothetical protein